MQPNVTCWSDPVDPADVDGPLDLPGPDATPEEVQVCLEELMLSVGLMTPGHAFRHMLDFGRPVMNRARHLIGVEPAAQVLADSLKAAEAGLALPPARQGQLSLRILNKLIGATNGDLCEWNPVAHTEATGLRDDDCRNSAVVSVGHGRWHLCRRCAGLPEFRRYSQSPLNTEEATS